MIEEVWKETDKQLRKGVMDGYGKKGYDLNDFDTVFQLNTNVGVFSAFKSYRVNQEMKANLTNENGEKLSFDKFLDRYQKVDAEYNANYLRSEYNLAQRQAQSANQWNDYQRDKDLYPNLKYMPSRSAEPRDDHRKYYGKVKPIDDPVWDTLMPPLAWGCSCGVTNTDEPAEATTIEPPLPIDGITGNPGKNGSVFTKTHPFVKKVDRQAKQQVATFLSKMKEKHLSDEHLSGKYGKGRIKISLNTDHADFSRNINIATTISKNHGKTIEIRSHSFKEDVKNPELKYQNTIGDATLFEGSNASSYIKNSFSKFRPDRQFKNLKSAFLALDFNGKINKANSSIIARKVWGEFRSHDRCEFMIIKNKNRSVVIDGKDNYNSILNKVKGELL